MSIEVCEFLRPSLKAKVQDCGVLYLSDLLLLLRQCGVLHSGSEDISVNDHSATNTTSAALLSHPPNGLNNISAVNESGSKRSMAQATLLAERLPRLTKLELVDLITSTQRYLQTLDMTTQHTPAHNEVPQCRSTSSMALPALSIGPVTCAIRTLSELRAEAVAALQNGRSAHHATTFSRSLDTLLGGGAAVGELTELSGPPGAGKTQLLLQLAVSCVLPVELGGLDGECVFVDTEGSFAAERFLQLVVAAVALVRDLAARYNAATHTTATNATTATHTTSETVQEDKRKTRRGRKRRRRNGGQRVTQNNNNKDNNNTQRHRSEVNAVDTQCGPSPAMTSPSANMEEEERSCYTVSSAPPCSQGSNPPCGDNFTQAPRHTLHEGEGEGEVRQMNTRQEEPKAKDLPTLAAQFTVEYVLRRVHYVRITDLTTFMAFLYALPASLQSSASQHNQDEAAALIMEDKQNDNVTVGENGLGASSPLPPTRLKNVKMVLIDSIAQPFRSFAAMNEGSEETTMHSASHANEQKGNTMRGDTSGNGPRAAMSERERLWRRSRLIFTCAQRLQAYAAKFRLAIVVSNQVTSRTLNMPATDLMKRKESSSSARQRTTILLPALGDAWGYGVGTRVLLSFHHYLLPRTAACDMTNNSYSGDKASEALMKSCPQEDMALCFASATTAPRDGSHITNKDDVTRRAVDNVHQHRVARLLKSATEQRGECCFAITRKGIRDVYLLQSAMTGGN